MSANNSTTVLRFVTVLDEDYTLNEVDAYATGIIDYIGLLSILLLNSKLAAVSIW